MDKGLDYAMGDFLTEQPRLLELAKLLAPQASWLLDHLQIQPGSRAIDLGCGPLGILDLLAKRVGPKGEVIGIEFEPQFVEIANSLMAERKLDGVRIIQGDATATSLPADTFDLVHERLLLISVHNPEYVAAEMVRLAKPGGIVAVEDFDLYSFICEPPHPAWTRLFEVVFHTLHPEIGKNSNFGRRNPRLLRAAGLLNVDYNVHARFSCYDEYYRQTLPLFVKRYWQKIVELELLTEEELTDLYEQL
ncbi:MAG: methyltransferase domain-containing protein [Candidatus Binatia bacterium]